MIFERQGDRALFKGYSIKDILVFIGIEMLE